MGDRGGTVGPILDQVGNRRTKEWLSTWLKDPNAVKAGTQMPNFQFSPEEVEEVVGYLTRLRKEVPTQEILSREAPLAEKGRELLEAYGCQACHRIGDAGRFVGVDLTWVGKRKSTAWEQIWLKNPQEWNRETFMPNFRLTDGEIRALAAYLSTLQGEHNDAGKRWEARSRFFLGGSRVTAGKMVYDRFGCWGCHGKKGRKPDRNPNAAPDERVPELWGTMNRLSDEQVEQIIRTGSRSPSLDQDKPPPYFACPEWKDDISDDEMTSLIAYLKTLGPEKKEWRFR